MSLRESKTFQNVRHFADLYPELEFSAIEACLYLMMVAKDLMDAMDTHFARNDLSKGRFQVLASLARHGGTLTPAELAESCSVTRATVTGLLDTLEASELIERADVVADRRSVAIRLTEAGHAHLHKMLPDHYARIANLMRSLSKSDRAALVTLLEKIESGIPAVREP